MQAKPRRQIKLIVLLLVLTAGFTAAQDYQIRSRVELVLVPVTVKGAGGKMVSDLKKEDFTILEDDTKQEIATFSTDPVPLSVAVLLDTDLSALSFEKVRNTFPALAAAFSPFDEVALYRFSHVPAKFLDFTSDPQVVQAAVKELKDVEPRGMPNASGPFQSPGPLINGVPTAPSAAIVGAQPDTKEAKVLDDALFMAAEDLAKHNPPPSADVTVQKRKIIIVVSDGRNIGNHYSYNDTLKRLLQAEIQVYAIGMDSAVIGRRVTVLDSFAKATGGDSFFLNSTEALEAAYSRSTEEARNLYTLAYYSSNKPPAKQPVYRTIDVQVSRKGVQLLHKQGYYQYPPS